MTQVFSVHVLKKDLNEGTDKDTGGSCPAGPDSQGQVTGILVTLVVARWVTMEPWLPRAYIGLSIWSVLIIALFHLYDASLPKKLEILKANLYLFIYVKQWRSYILQHIRILMAFHQLM